MPTSRRSSPLRLGLLHEDDAVLVVDKPPGLLTTSTAKEQRRTVFAQLFDYVKRKKPPEKVFVVHRLDRDASGLLVFAKTEDGKHALQAQFRAHSAGRTYVALVEGVLRDDELTMRSLLAENAAHKVYSTVDPLRGKAAVTHLKVLRRGPRLTLVELRLETGRKHQIRVHLAALGHPIVGDKTYGSQLNPLSRLALHAVRLSFVHPVSGQRLELDSPCPSAFSKQLSRAAGPPPSLPKPPRPKSRPPFWEGGGRAARPAAAGGPPTRRRTRAK